MEAVGMNGNWLSVPTFEDLNHEYAIRQFGPARMEQEKVAEWGEMLMDEEMGVWPQMFDEMIQLDSSEVDEIVDTFFNVECYQKDNADNEPFDQFQDQGFEDLCMIEGDDDLVGCNPCDDLGVFRDGVEDSIPIGIDQGLQLVHLLLACAEAVGCRDARLADSILTQIWPCVFPWGDSLQRVSHCFAMGLKSRLLLLKTVNPNGSFNNTKANDVSSITREEKNEAFALLHQTTPYITFGFMAANDAIYHAASGKDFLHILDLGMEHNLQWPSLVRNLASRDEGPPKVIRITGIIGEDQNPLELETSMKGLCEEANFLGICLEFHLVAEQVTPLLLTREKLELRHNEALFVNSIMHFHKHVKESRGSLKTILQSIKKLSPSLLTVVEQDANHNGPFFLGRFLESLHYYSAVFDSLDASLPRNSPQRMKIEKFHFAEEIRNVIAYEGSDRIERHERADQWRRQLGRAGFQVVGLQCLDEAKMVVSGYGCDGYTVASEKGCLQLGWKGRAIMLASAWKVHSVNSS